MHESPRTDRRRATRLAARRRHWWNTPRLTDTPFRRNGCFNLQLAESLDGFRIKLRERAKSLDVCERQQILRLIVKEVLVAADSLTIRHSIPIPQTGPVSNGPQPTGAHPFGASQKPSYLLRSRSSITFACECLLALRCAR